MTNEEREDLNTFRHDLIKRARWWQWKAETLQKENEQLKAENAELREKIEKALELPRIERLFNGKVSSYKVVYQDKNNRITSEYYSDEKREAAEARLAELNGLTAVLTVVERKRQ